MYSHVPLYVTCPPTNFPYPNVSPPPPPPPPPPLLSGPLPLPPPSPAVLPAVASSTATRPKLPPDFFRSRAKSDALFSVPLKENDRPSLPYHVWKIHFIPPPPPLLHLPFSFSQLTSANLATIVIIQQLFSHRHTNRLSDLRSFFLSGHQASTSFHVRLATLATTTPFFLSIATASDTPHHPPAGRDRRHATSAFLCCRSLLSRLIQGRLPRLPPPQIRGDERFLPPPSPAPCDARPTSARFDRAPDRPPESRPRRDKRWRKTAPPLTAPESSRLDIVLPPDLELSRRTRPASTNSRQLAAYPTTTLRTRDCPLASLRVAAT